MSWRYTSLKASVGVLRILCSFEVRSRVVRNLQIAAVADSIAYGELTVVLMGLQILTLSGLIAKRTPLAG